MIVIVIIVNIIRIRIMNIIIRMVHLLFWWIMIMMLFYLLFDYHMIVVKYFYNY